MTGVQLASGVAAVAIPGIIVYRSKLVGIPAVSRGEEVSCSDSVMLTDRQIFMLKVFNKTRGTTVGDSVELADTSLKRIFGLLGRRGLDVGGGLWIKPSSGVHTFGMAFGIDVVGLDRDLKIVKLWRCLRPFRVTSVSFRLKSVLELPCGVISQSQMQLGDQLQIVPSLEASPGSGVNQSQ